MSDELNKDEEATPSNEDVTDSTTVISSPDPVAKDNGIPCCGQDDEVTKDNEVSKDDEVTKDDDVSLDDQVSKEDSTVP